MLWSDNHVQPGHDEQYISMRLHDHVDDFDNDRFSLVSVTFSSTAVWELWPEVMPMRAEFAVVVAVVVVIRRPLTGCQEVIELSFG